MTQGIFAAMLAVKAQANKDGIAKDRETKAEGRYKYRGVDDAINYFAQVLVDNKVGWKPSYTNIQRETRKTKNGEGIITTLEGTFVFFTVDGSELITGPFMGEAFDSMDKSGSKAMSVALRNCLLQTFVVPLGPGNDPEEGDDEPGDEATTGRGDGKPAREVPEGADPGINLSKSKRAWLDAKLKQYGCSEKELLTAWPSVDETNLEAVGAWLKG